jgi:2-hydroxychromene-2-carboxylate isomerase
MFLRSEHEVIIDLRIVHPNALRTPGYFQRMDPLARPYFLQDSARVAAFYGIPFRRPIPDPIKQDPVTLNLDEAQPLARRLGRLGVAATDSERGLEFCMEVSSLLWGGHVDGWDEGMHLRDAATRAGLDLARLDARIAEDPNRYEARLADNNASLRAAGHWGVPTMVFEGEPFFGQDRFDVLVWRMKQREVI